jgi:hypothetical protein
LQACSAATFATYWRLREHAVPVGSNSTFDAACARLLDTLLSTNAAAYKAAYLFQHPQLLELGSSEFDRVITRNLSANSFFLPEELPDATPALAWVPDYLQPAVPSPLSRVLAASYEAMDWLQLHAVKLPMFANATLPQQLQQQDEPPAAAEPGHAGG